MKHERILDARGRRSPGDVLARAARDYLLRLASPIASAQRCLIRLLAALYLSLSAPLRYREGGRVQEGPLLRNLCPARRHRHVHRIALGDSNGARSSPQRSRDSPHVIGRFYLAHLLTHVRPPQDGGRTA